MGNSSIVSAYVNNAIHVTHCKGDTCVQNLQTRWRRCSVSLLPRVRHCGTAHSMPLTLKHIISGRGSWCRPTIDGLSEAVEDDVKNMQVDAVEEDKRGRLKEEVIAPLR